MVCFARLEIAGCYVLQEAYCCVELHGSLTRGQLIVDEKQQYKTPANVRLVTDVDMDRLKAMLSDSVSKNAPAQ